MGRVLPALAPIERSIGRDDRRAARACQAAVDIRHTVRRNRPEEAESQRKDPPSRSCWPSWWRWPELRPVLDDPPPAGARSLEPGFARAGADAEAFLGADSRRPVARCGLRRGRFSRGFGGRERIATLRVRGEPP